MDRAAFFENGFLGKFGYEPTPCQARLFHTLGEFLASDDADILVVNGYAGTGKTSALAAVINSLKDYGIASVLLAPTGRAAKVFSAFAGAPAQTIHKCIYRQKGVSSEGRGSFSLYPNKSKSTLFVVDEASLIGIDTPVENASSIFGSGNLLDDLISYVRSGADCRLVLVGDSAQLPPVGMDESPALARDFISVYGGVMFEELSTVVRQAESSGILRNATVLRKNLQAGSIRLDLRSCTDVERVTGERLIDTITSAYETYGEDETIVLCRSNKMAIRYNLGIRSTVQFKEERLLRGDKLMIVKNCYQFLGEDSKMGYMANGDIAELKKIGGYEERYGLHFADAVLSTTKTKPSTPRSASTPSNPRPPASATSSRTPSTGEWMRTIRTSNQRANATQPYAKTPTTTPSSSSTPRPSPATNPRAASGSASLSTAPSGSPSRARTISNGFTPH